jgi:uncharacterized protein YecT (DUF1311 family)
VSQIGCSASEVKATLEELVWEGVATAVAQELSQDRVADITAAAKANLKVRFDGVAMIPGQNGARPTCEATVVGSAAQPLNPDSNWLQKAMRRDGGLKVSGKDLVGNVAYTVTPADDGKTFRVSATGLDTYALGVADLGIGFRNQELHAKYEADQRAKAAPSPAPAPMTPSAVSSAAGSAADAATSADLQGDAESAFQAADKGLNAAYSARRAKMSDAQKTALRDQQRSWIKTRDATCSEAKITADSKGDIAGGSAMALELVSCKTRLTEERAKQLAAKG